MIIKERIVLFNWRIQMKTIDKSLLERIKDFISLYQLEHAKSPSYRVIMKHFNLSSLSLVSRYLDLLQKEGQITKTPLGGIDMSYKFSLATYAPLVGQVRCGSPILAQENYQSICALPSEIFGKGDLFMLKAVGDSMEGAGIQDGDILIVRKTDYADSGQIVVALLGDEATVKRLQKKNRKIILHPENDKYADIEANDVKILGVVQSMIHKF